GGVREEACAGAGSDPRLDIGVAAEAVSDSRHGAADPADIAPGEHTATSASGAGATQAGDFAKAIRGRIAPYDAPRGRGPARPAAERQVEVRGQVVEDVLDPVRLVQVEAQDLTPGDVATYPYRACSYSHAFRDAASFAQLIQMDPVDLDAQRRTHADEI